MKTPEERIKKLMALMEQKKAAPQAVVKEDPEEMDEEMDDDEDIENNPFNEENPFEKKKPSLFNHKGKMLDVMISVVKAKR